MSEAVEKIGRSFIVSIMSDKSEFQTDRNGSSPRSQMRSSGGSGAPDNIKKIDRRLTVAPMMAWTDRHCRYFHRLITPHALLYSEMITPGALLHNDPARFISFNEAEHPVALQIGGSDPDQLAEATRLGCEFRYDEINLNCGCPSERVQNNSFGACLMAEPELVADCVAAMTEAANPFGIPVTVKTRIGIDEQDSYQFVHRFISTIYEQTGCEVFILHARKAWLKGLSPKENRNIPELRYETVYQLKRDFPGLEILINGGIETWDDIALHLKQTDGVMLGRQAYHDPYSLATFEHKIYGTPIPARAEIARGMIPYIKGHIETGGRAHDVVRHMLGLYRDIPGAKRWRQVLSTAHQEGTGADIIEEAIAAVERTAMPPRRYGTD